MKNSDIITDKLIDLSNKLVLMGKTKEEIMSALLKRWDRSKNRYVHEEEKSLFEALREDETVVFWSERNFDSKVEVTAYSHEIDIDDAIIRIHSPYDCTGLPFTMDIRQFFNKYLNKYIVIHHIGYDV